ncbi:MAG: hypothetical protein A2V72_02695 [Candidatus Nealsonbacteria bacterium RBG_13_37_56]|uniref:Uncharacterized protein n=1 Tax=Candidatus Nealsonbacteria bacterium RBG_13_37_56 TaxID=1801661 RepID=A0A1G2DXD3_9BACT|nr:MAG: hypothetical protein A2V72_02695 [Candidatus Nealsonbacteria bacterium RBG_13_37_56]HJX46008.1 hypothetical protein [Patescibacteria group bacterium]
MEIIRKAEGNIKKLYQILMFITLARDLDVTHESVIGMGMEKFEKVYYQYFENLMNLPPNELQTYMNQKISKVPEGRRELARLFLQGGMKEYIKKQEQKKV